MAKKYTVIFIATILFFGVLRAGLCQTIYPKITSECCPIQGSSSKDSEDCFSHCARQKIYAIRTESSLKEALKIKTSLFLENKFSNDPQKYRFNPFLSTNYHPSQEDAKLNISQIYFLAIFNHAPPFLFC